MSNDFCMDIDRDCTHIANMREQLMMSDAALTEATASIIQMREQLATITRQRDLAVSALKQSREALRLPCDRWNKTQFEIVQSAIASIDSAIKESEV